MPNTVQEKTELEVLLVLVFGAKSVVYILWLLEFLEAYRIAPVDFPVNCTGLHSQKLLMLMIFR